ncbi:MAG: hypothetical protein K8S21_11420 [Gemmatimonadetes bacterium]|nr:hypothetical protein [Gemmatimonadota bacterium]
MPTLADRPIAIAKETTRSTRPARPERARPNARPQARPDATPERGQPRVVGRFIDGVDAFADRLMTLVFSTGTAQAFE